MKVSKGQQRNHVKGMSVLCLITLFLLLAHLFYCSSIDVHDNEFVVSDVKDECSLNDREDLAIAKAKFAIQYPFGQYPLELVRCEESIKKRSSSGGIFKDVFIAHSALQPHLPLSAPEFVLDTLLSTSESQQADIIDVGANIGQFAIPLAKQGHRVISFEPNSGTCLKLKDNIKNNQLDGRVRVICSGISDAKETLSFGYVADRDPGSQSYMIVDPSNKNTHVVSTVRMEPLDGFIDTHRLRNILAFKTDTQGNEGAVLRGAEKLLMSPEHPRFLLIEFSYGLLKSTNTDPHYLLDLVARAGYVCTHLVFHHLTRITEGTYHYDLVDTPKGLVSNSSSPLIVNFDVIAHAIGPHGEWEKNGMKLDSSLQHVGGWTDLLCVG